MVIAVETPKEPSSKKDAPKNDTLVFASSPVSSDASFDKNEESVVVQQQDEENQTNSNAMVTCLDPVSSSPTKKRRVHSHQQQEWNVFVRQGTSLKGLLENVLQLATTSTSSTPAVSSNEDHESAMEMRPLPQENTQQQQQHAADLARAKTRECMILEKKLSEAQAHVAALTAANDSLRESAASTNERMERTVQALTIASQGAANARADADAAEACAASMATQLQALREVVEETKRASQVLYQEQEQVAAGARSMETHLLQRETELARAKQKERQWKLQREEMKLHATKCQEKMKCLQDELQHVTRELQTAQQQANQHAAMEQARKDRASMVEDELRQARSMLQHATSTAAETEATAQVLQDAIHQVQQENKTLSEAMEQLQAKARQDNEGLQESLGKAEKEAQTLRVEAASHQDDLQRIRMDRAASEKEVAKLKQKVSSLERRLKDFTTSSSSAAAYSALEDAAYRDSHLAGESTSSSTSRAGSVSFSIPPLTATNTPATASGKSHGKDQHWSTHRVTPGGATTSKSATCFLCSQAAVGLMKSCQCNKPSCNLRAHSSCIAKQFTRSSGPSVAHPGTPAPPTLLLCASTTTK